MADGTRSRWKTVAWRGAARVAPTAPHGTPPEDPSGPSAGKRKRTGPERFWWPRYVLPVFVVGLVLSLVAHVAFFGRSLFDDNDFVFNDQDGEATIPIDLLTGEQEPENTPPEPPPSSPIAPTPNGTESAMDAGLYFDAGRIRDAAVLSDASDIFDAQVPHDAASATRDAGLELTAGDAAVATLDAGSTPRNAVDMIGAAGAVEAGKPLVVVLVNMVEIRKNSVGAQIGPLLSGIPQWDEFMHGTHVDPVRDTDWVLISGPSLKDTARDIILVHYSMDDRIADRAIERIEANQTPGTPGGPFDAGVPGVKATLSRADRAPRVFMRPKTHFIAVVPPDTAHTIAAQLVKTKVEPRVRPGEAMRLILQHPHGPFPDFFPDEMTELDLWIIPRTDGGADIHGDGICPNEQIAQTAVGLAQKALKGFVMTWIGGMVNSTGKGFLDGVKLTQDGTHEKLEATVSNEQLEGLLNGGALLLGVSLPPAAPGH